MDSSIKHFPLLKAPNKFEITFMTSKCRCLNPMERQMPQPDLSALKDDIGTLPLSDDYLPAVMQALHYFTEMMQYEQLQNPATTTRKPAYAPTTTRPTTTTTRRTTTTTTTRRTTTTTPRTTTTTTQRTTTPRTTQRTTTTPKTTQRTTTTPRTTQRTTTWKTTQRPFTTKTTPTYQIQLDIPRKLKYL